MVALFFVIKLKLQGVEALLLAQISVSSKKKKKTHRQFWLEGIASKLALFLNLVSKHPVSCI